MIIKRVNNLSNKSFKSFTGPNDGFNKKNIFFGYNGRGKSSLANGIVKEVRSKEGTNNNAIRLYDKNYIKDNLFLKNDNKIKGIVASFGEKSINAEQKIVELQKEKVDTTELEEEKEELNTEIRYLIDEIHDRRKGTTNISKKRSNYTIEKVIESYYEDQKKALTIEADEDTLLGIQGDNSLEKRKKEIEAINIVEISVQEPLSKLNKINHIFNKEFNDIVIPSSEVIEWLNKGLKVHNENDECKFCGNSMELELIKEKITSYNSNEKQKSIIELEEFKGNLNDLLSKINTLVKNEGAIELFLNEKNTIEDLKKELGIINDIIKILESKIDDLFFEKRFPNDIIQNSLYNIELIYKDIMNSKNLLIDDLERKVRSQEQLVKGAISLEIAKNEIIQKKINDFSTLEKEIENTKSNNEKLDKEIKQQEDEKSDISDFAIHLNDVFRDINMPLKLELDDAKKNYILKHSFSDHFLTVNDISEGEKNLLALLFYYFDLYSDSDQQVIKKDVKLLVIDDPVSSMDEHNRFFVLELMKGLLEEEDIQLFIMTHVWNDFCDLSYNREKDDDFSFFEIFKNENSESSIRTIKTHDKPYKKLFTEIYLLSEKSRDEALDDCEVYHLPNSMRRVLEEFLSFKSSKGIVPTKNKQKAIENIFEITSNNQKTKLGQLLTICNVMSHSIQYNPEEVWKSARFLMNQIKKIDEKHYMAMRGTN